MQGIYNDDDILSSLRRIRIITTTSTMLLPRDRRRE